MTTRVKYSTEQLNDLLNFKEQEWRNALQGHVDTLVKELAEKDELIALEKIRFLKLKEDFQYNLKLVEDRDKDLQRYEQLFEQIKKNENLNDHQVSEMKIKIDEFQSKFIILEKEKEEMQHHYQMRLKHYQEEMNKFYTKKDEEHQKERKEYEELKRKLQRKIRDTEEELAFEKQKILKELEEAVKQKEQEFQIKLDQNDAEIHSYQLKVKMLSRELNVVHSSNTEVTEHLESNKENVVQLGRLLKEKEWELQDQINMKDLKIMELEVQLDENQKSMKWKTEEFERKYSELEKLSNERENNLTNLRTAADNNEIKLREDLKLLHQQKEEMELNYKRLEWKMSDVKFENEKELGNYVQKVENLEKNLKEEIDAMNKATVAKDLQLEALKSSEDFLRKESNKLRSDADRLKKDLSLAMDRERILENAKVQLELDWRRRYETKESDLYQKHDELLKKNTQEKEEAIHAKKQMESELSRRENLIKLLEDDKVIAIKCLHDHGINTDTMFADGIPEREAETMGIIGGQDGLQKQNNQLKYVIKEMRAEMELLSQQVTSSTSTPNKASEDKSNYVSDLESEVQNLKATNRNLLIKLEDLTKYEKPPLEPIREAKMKLYDPGITRHIKELNDTIGALRNEKVLMCASLNSKDATVNHQKAIISKLRNEKQQQVVVIDNLKYDITSNSKICEQNIASLKTRIAELELHLQQARSEAEIYYKSVLERNSNATEANNKLSDLKLQQSTLMDIPSRRAPLEDIKSASFYKEKLKLAVERIKELAVERSQLINVGNKLRAKLEKLKETTRISEAADQDVLRSSSNMHQYGNKIQSKLEQLEKLNYETVTRELRKDPKSKEMDVNIRLMSSADISEITDNGDNHVDHTVKDAAKENRPPSSLLTLSENSSINEIWKLLENAEEISLPGNNESQSLIETGDLELVGKHINPDTKKTVNRSPVLKPKKVVKTKKRPVIRNYNKKDDMFMPLQ